ATVAASSSAPPIDSALVPSGPIRWADFTGPFEKSKLTGGERVWVVMPVNTGWETLKFAEHDVARIEENEVIVRPRGVDVFVPTVFVSLAEAPKNIARGDAVMASAHDTRVFARVVATGKKAKVRFRFASNIEEV